MTRKIVKPAERRRILKGLAATAGVAAVSSFVPVRFAIGQQAKIRLGLMLPYSGTYAALGKNIDDALPAAHRRARAASSAGARSSTSRSTTSPTLPRARENANTLVSRDKVDVLVGTVHSGVVMGMVKVAREHAAR